MKIGFMQGRLVEPQHAKIQEFPSKDWEKELVYANSLDFQIIEWVLDKKSISTNPLLINANYVKHALEKNNVIIGSVSDDFFLQFENSEIISKEILKHIENVFIKMSELNISLYVLPLLENKSLKYLEIKDQILILKTIEEMVPNNIKICLETDLNYENINLIFNSINTDIFRINYDIGNSVSNGFDPSIELPILQHWITNIHIKDRYTNGSTVSLGHGHANFELFFSTLKKFDYQYDFIIQGAREDLHDSIITPQSTCEKYFKFVNKYLKVYNFKSN